MSISVRGPFPLERRSAVNLSHSNWTWTLLRRPASLLILAAFTGFLAGCASPVVSAGPLRFGPTKAGVALVDDRGMTLYTYDGDKAGVPTCVAGCADLWPPELAISKAQLSGKSGVVLRPDGFTQWAYDGKPLYRYAGDADPGDAWVDGLLGQWHVVGP